MGISKAIRFSVAAAVALGSVSCVYIDSELGSGMIPTDQQWKVYTTDNADNPLVLEDIEMQPVNNLGAYSSRRITVGGIEDSDFGLVRKSTAFTLLPTSKGKMDLGKNPRNIRFHLGLELDTISFVNDADRYVVQGIAAYALTDTLGSNYLYAAQIPEFDGTQIVSKGYQYYEGGDSLTIDFSTDFALKYYNALNGLQIDTLTDVTVKVPGVYLRAEGGTSRRRINMFKIKMTSDDYGYLTGNYASLRFTADFDDRTVDTSIVLMVGGASLMDSTSTSLPTQYAFNVIEHDAKAESLAGVVREKTGDKLYIEGGIGLKPVIRAKELRTLALQELDRQGLVGLDASGEPKDTNKLKEIIVNKATIMLPYTVPADMDAMNFYPPVLSPTIRKVTTYDNGTKEYVSFAGLTDASVSTENQGDINRSLRCYCPDISHHLQELLKVIPKSGESAEDYEKRLSGYDIWLLIMHDETTTSSNNSSSSSYNDYLNALAYSSYYNNLYGYGGYGYGSYGYGSYGYNSYYNNYYNYMMMAAMYSSSSSSTTTTSSELDKDRFYKACLNGPAAVGGNSALPKLQMTFSAPKTSVSGE